jgi:hypothetical protein
MIEGVGGVGGGDSKRERNVVSLLDDYTKSDSSLRSRAG